jgi:DNA-binding PadR family transcriptional regulator
MGPGWKRKILEMHQRDRHGPFGDWGDFFREPAPRADRGTVRYLVLDALQVEPRHGYEILRVITEKSGGVYRPSPGVIYPTLQMLEELGHIQLTQREERKVYAITAEGRTELASHTDEVKEFYESSSDQGVDGREGDLRHLAQRFRRLLHLFKRSLRRGRLAPSKIRRVRTVLDQAIDQLEELLEEEA